MNSKGKIMVVDDSSENLELLSLILNAEGYQTLSVNNGEQALKTIETHAPELILLDIRMPGLDGFEVIRRLNACADRSIPVIFISGGGEVKERVEGLKLGAVDFINKPFQRAELLARVQTHLELRRLRVQLEQQADGLRQVNEQLQIELAERKRAERELSQKNAELASALANVKLISGLLPICSGCKQIRDDKGYWSQVESYISEHSQARFTHGLCPECALKYFPNLSETTNLETK